MAGSFFNPHRWHSHDEEDDDEEDDDDDDDDEADEAAFASLFGGGDLPPSTLADDVGDDAFVVAATTTTAAAAAAELESSSGRPFFAFISSFLLPTIEEMDISIICSRGEACPSPPRKRQTDPLHFIITMIILGMGVVGLHIPHPS